MIYFWKSIRSYYQEYKYDNALTSDFKRVVEDIAHEDLTLFFDQWLCGIGQPEIDLQWKNKTNKVEISIGQEQKN